MNSSQQTWIEEEQRVAAITDALGKGVDEGIKDIVIALRVFGFPTAASCEGHFAWGDLYPWVRINIPEQDQEHVTKPDSETKERWRKQNLAYAQQLIQLLGEFYEQHHAPFDVALSLEYMGWGRFFLQSTGSAILSLLPEQEQHEKQLLYRQELKAFADFLHNKL